jgi:hypothetical protein
MLEERGRCRMRGLIGGEGRQEGGVEESDSRGGSQIRGRENKIEGADRRIEGGKN